MESKIFFLQFLLNYKKKCFLSYFLDENTCSYPCHHHMMVVVIGVLISVTPQQLWEAYGLCHVRPCLVCPAPPLL